MARQALFHSLFYASSTELDIRTLLKHSTPVDREEQSNETIWGDESDVSLCGGNWHESTREYTFDLTFRVCYTAMPIASGSDMSCITPLSSSSTSNVLSTNPSILSSITASRLAFARRLALPPPLLSMPPASSLSPKLTAASSALPAIASFLPCCDCVC